MHQIVEEVKKGGNLRLPNFCNMIIIAADIYNTPTRCDIVVSSPGLHEVKKTVRLGDAVLFEYPPEGVFEVRCIGFPERNSVRYIELLISQISPQPGIKGGFAINDSSNAPFSPDETLQISQSIKNAESNLRKDQAIPKEQLDLITERLEEIELASHRLGRKDWINYVTGSLTSMCISAAFSPEITRKIFHEIGSALSWLITNIHLLPA